MVQVEVSLDNGNTWETATWLYPLELYSWGRWSWTWHALRPGTYHLMVKAIDTDEHTQPMQAEWNLKGMKIILFITYKYMLSLYYEAKR